MTITEAKFAGSCTRVNQKPSRRLPEFAFIGRSNVGKSSLINMLCGNSKLAKTSSTPGKTKLINHFIINDSWTWWTFRATDSPRSPRKDGRNSAR